MQTQIDVLNQIIDDIIDSCIKKDNYRIFHHRVKPKDAPGYFDIVKNPIDFSVMKSKAKRKMYLDVQAVKEDFALLKSNSQTYNGLDHSVTKLATDIEDHALKLLREKHNEIL